MRSLVNIRAMYEECGYDTENIQANTQMGYTFFSKVPVTELPKRTSTLPLGHLSTDVLLTLASYNPTTKKCVMYDVNGNENWYGAQTYAMNAPNLVKRFGGIDNFKTEVTNALSQSYKFHLQPKAERLAEVVKRLSKVSTTVIWTFKVINDYAYVYDYSFPAIVVYPHYGYETAAKLKMTLLREFFDIAEEGLGVVPRFSEKINSLIYSAGGDGDYKIAYGKESGIFSDDFVYYAGQKRLV